MKKKTLYFILGGIVLLVILLLVLKKAGVLGGNEGIKVAVEKAEPKNIIETVSASGKIYPEIEVKVSSDVSGEITDLPVEEGDSVTRGQVIAKIYADIYGSIKQRSEATLNQVQAQLSNAKASLGAYKAKLDQAKTDYDRDKKLLDKKVISTSEFEQAQSAYLSAQADYNAAEQQIKAAQYGVASSQADLSQASENLNRTTITAPMSGVISLLDVKKGERVVGTAQMTGTEIMRIADMSSIEVQVDVGENDVPKVHYNDTAVIEVDAYNDRKFKGIVTQIASSSNNAASASVSSSSAEEVTNYTVHIRIFPSSYQDLLDPKHPKYFPFRPGMSASVDIQTQHHNNVLSVPINAVTTRTDLNNKKADSLNNKPQNVAMTTPAKPEEIVFVLQKDNTVKAVKVQTAIQDDNNIQVTSGLQQGQQVVSGPYSAISKDLKDGSKVQVVPQDKLFEVGQ